MINMNYTVTINNLHTKTIEDKNDFVSLIEFEYSSTVDGVCVSTLGVLTFDAPQQEYTPFTELTEQQVVEWVNASSDIALLQSTLQCKLDALTQPPLNQSVTKNAPPWMEIEPQVSQ